MSSSTGKKSRGRQKIEMKKMTNESNLQVTFSKRRTGLFKKASELCTLCGAEVALIVFSPGDKVFSFGHPNVEAVIDRYLARTPVADSSAMQLIEAHRSAYLRDLTTQLTQINGQLETQQKRGEELAGLKKAIQAQLWWARPVDDLSLAQLLEYRVALDGLKKHVGVLKNRAVLQSAASPTQQFFPRASASSSNNVHQAHSPQVFTPELIQPPMLHNYMFDDETMMHHHTFNNIGFGGYPAGHGYF